MRGSFFGDEKDGCGAEIAIAAGDLVHMYFKGEYFAHSYAAVKCPQCGKHTKVKDVPDPILEELFKTERTHDGFDNSR